MWREDSHKKIGEPGKNPRSKDENQQQTQSAPSLLFVKMVSLINGRHPGEEFVKEGHCGKDLSRIER